MLKIRNLRVYRGDAEIVRGVSVDFAHGVHIILGTNGSGKSTLAGGIMGIYPTTGKIIVEGMRVDKKSITERAKMGMTLAFQEPTRFEGIRVKDYLLASSLEKSLDEVYEMIRLIGLPEEILMKKMDDTLSGGERKRIELVSVLLMHPKIAILDEPDSGIDMLSYGKIINAVKILREQGACVLLITHNRNLLTLGDYAHIMTEGKIVKSGEPEEMSKFFTTNFSEGEGYGYN